MTLKDYFTSLIQKVESSDAIHNGGKDESGFYKPTRTIILQKLNLLRDLHAKPLARPMVRDAWKEVVNALPPEWLILEEPLRSELRAIVANE
jgi:hypothetical protein